MQRITSRLVADSSYANLQASMARSANLQEQLSSGRRIAKPSDSPAGTTSALQLRANIAANEQYTRNATSGMSWLDTADAALQQASDALQQARAKAVQGGSGANSQTAREAIAAEVSGIREALLGIANSQYLGRPVFGGTTTGGVAFAEDGGYVGDSGVVERQVAADAKVRVDVDGAQTFGDVFAVLDDMVATLRAGGSSSASVDGIDRSLERVVGALSDVGARANRLENVKARNDLAAGTLRAEQSQVEFIDLPKTIVELQLQETAYQASLAATARVIQPSLLDFLR